MSLLQEIRAPQRDPRAGHGDTGHWLPPVYPSASQFSRTRDFQWVSHPLQQPGNLLGGFLFCGCHLKSFLSGFAGGYCQK